MESSNTGMNTAYNHLGLLPDASSLPGRMVSRHCPLNMENEKDNPADYDSDETYYDAGGSSMRPNSLSAPDAAGKFVSNYGPGLLQAQTTKSGPTMEGPTKPFPISTEINENDDTGSDLDQFVNDVLPSILGDFESFESNDGQDDQSDNGTEFMPHSQFIDNNRWTDSNFDNEMNKLTSQITLDHFLNSQESYEESIATNVTTDGTLVDLFNVSASQHHDYSISQENRNVIDNACFRAVAERSNKKPTVNVSHPKSIGKRMETIRALLKGKKPVEKLRCPKELTIQLRSREKSTLKGVTKKVPQNVKTIRPTVKSISTRKDSQPQVNNSDDGKLTITRLEKLRKSNELNKPSKLDYKNKVQSSLQQIKKHQRASKRTSHTSTTRRPTQSLLTELNKMRDEVSEIQDDVRTSIFYDGTPLTTLKADEYLTQLRRHLERLDTIKKGPKVLIDEIKHVIGQLVCMLNKCLDDMKLVPVSTQETKKSYSWQNETIFEESERSSQSSYESENSDQEVPVDSSSDDICIINDAFECISITSSPVPSLTSDNQFEGQESFDMFETYEQPMDNEESNRTNESEGNSTYFTQSKKEPEISDVQLLPKVWTQKVKTLQENNNTHMLLEQSTPMDVTQTEEENRAVRKTFSVSTTEMGAQKPPIQTQAVTGNRPEYLNVTIPKQPIQTQAVTINRPEYLNVTIPKLPIQTQAVTINCPEYLNVTIPKGKPFYDFNAGRMRAVSNDERLVPNATQSSLHSSVDFIDNTQLIDLTGDKERGRANNDRRVVSLAKETNSSTKFLVPVVTTTHGFGLAGHQNVPGKVVHARMNAASSLAPRSMSPDYNDTQMMLEETQCSLPKSTNARPILPVIVIRKVNDTLVCQPQQTVLPVTNFTPNFREINVLIPEKMMDRQSDAKNTNVSLRTIQLRSPIRSYKTVMNLNEMTGELEYLHGNQTHSNKRHSQELLASDDDTVSPDKKYKLTNNDLRSDVKSANASPHPIQESSPIRSYKTVMNLNEITGELEYLYENQIKTNKRDGQEIFGSDNDMISPQKKYKPRNEGNLVSLQKNGQKCVTTPLNSWPNVGRNHFMTNHEENSNSSQECHGTEIAITSPASSSGNENISGNPTNNGGNMTQMLLEDTQELIDESSKQTTSFRTNCVFQPSFSARNVPGPGIVKITKHRSTPMEISCVPSGSVKKISKNSPQSKALPLKVYAKARKSPTVGISQRVDLENNGNSQKNRSKVRIDLPIEPNNNHSFFEIQDVEMSNVENIPPPPLLLKSNYWKNSSRILKPKVNFSNDVNIQKPKNLSIVTTKTRKLSNDDVGMETQMLLDETQNDKDTHAERVKHSKTTNSPVLISKISTDKQNKSRCEQLRNSPAKPTASVRSRTDSHANADQLEASVSMEVENGSDANKSKSFLFVQSKKKFSPTKSRAFIDRDREEERRLIMGIKSVFIHSPDEWVPHSKEMAEFWRMPFDKIPEEILKDLEDSDEN